MRYRFIEQHRRQWPVTLMCQVLDVARSGYYAWCHRAESRASRRRRQLIVMIRSIHQEMHRTYGSPRMHLELLERNERCSLNFVAKLMRQDGIAAKTKRKFKVTTDSKHDLPVAQNLLERRFEQPAPNQAWVSDISYLPTREGWLYLAVVQDLFSRRIIGWAMSNRVTSRLTVDALQMALDRRRPAPGLIVHSDRGSQYASDHYQRLLRRHGARCSMSRKANCWDNAVVESFFRTLKTELVYWEEYETRLDARRSVFQYIETFYNTRRKHSSLGYHSPAQYEATHRRGRDQRERPPRNSPARGNRERLAWGAGGDNEHPLLAGTDRQRNKFTMNKT